MSATTIGKMFDCVHFYLQSTAWIALAYTLRKRVNAVHVMQTEDVCRWMTVTNMPLSLR